MEKAFCFAQPRSKSPDSRLIGVIDAMTAHERSQPMLIDLPRRRRIAQGAGVCMDEVADLLRLHRECERLCKELEQITPLRRLRLFIITPFRRWMLLRRQRVVQHKEDAHTRLRIIAATDKGFASVIRRRKNLSHVIVYKSIISDEACGALENLTALERLEVIDTPISDAALDSFARLPLLRVLRLRNTRVTDDGIALLRLRSPQLKLCVDD